MQQSEELTIAEVAHELGMTESAVRVAISQQRLAVARKIGKRLNLIARSEVERYKRERRPAGRPTAAPVRPSSQ